MKNFRYTLELYKTPSSRYTCPSCGQNGKFTRYIDSETRQHLAEHVGRCDREQNCGYHYTPKQYFLDNPDAAEHPHTPVIPIKPLPSRPASFIPSDIFEKSMVGYANNNFVTFLHSLFDETTVNSLINLYLIGTSKYWKGAVVFWQVDNTGNVKAGKIMLYNPESGRRVKKPNSLISWVHSVLKIKEYNLQQCFFGEHLLNIFPDLPVAIVESEKTAIIASIYFPQFVWLATGGKNGCKWTTREVWKVLISRKVILWPDVNAFHDWERKAQVLKQQGLSIVFSTLLESEATEEERVSGLDIADFLIRFNYERFWKASNSRAP